MDFTSWIFTPKKHFSLHYKYLKATTSQKAFPFLGLASCLSLIFLGGGPSLVVSDVGSASLLIGVTSTNFG
jgi:hypothetical protein